MDIFKQNRFLGWIVVLLVLLNLITLVTLWLGRPLRPVPRAKPVGPDREQLQMPQALRDGLGFDDAQIAEYQRLTRQHREEVRRLNEEIRQIKQRMFEGALQDSPTPELSESLLALAQQKQAAIEKATFQYFLDLKKLCRPDQQEKLKLLVDQLFRQPKGGQDQGRPQPPRDRQPPPRRPPDRR
jgi:hypothetical protein